MHPTNRFLLGPFTEIVTLEGLPLAGPIRDHQLKIIPNGGIVVSSGFIEEIGSYETLKGTAQPLDHIEGNTVAIPAFVDSHTHICFSGSRHKDYAARLEGKSYQEISALGGGILDSVKATRQASKELLFSSMLERIKRQMHEGVATTEVKSGYGLSVQEELKQLQAIRLLANASPMTLVPTCLAAHCRPPEFADNSSYLNEIVENLFPLLMQDDLTKRIDIFVEKGAFSIDEAHLYIHEAKKCGFSICIHADQFTRGGALLAAEMGALSADHLEVSQEQDFNALKAANVFPIVLPGASLGLGIPYAKARAMLDYGLPLVIASDWNPGSAPMGNLLAQASLIGMAEKLTTAETFAAITFRAAHALELYDRGILAKGMRADILAYKFSDYREILYHQGSIKPTMIWIGGALVHI